ncbi:sphingosine-1-phosphate phosphatase 2 isoform X2 [Boleophthalmus pectinirostris]|uniref:sphingosine-1-phosphate phosphatase 2 isoform X2 n=1 Tax=Boleophthalmus pectinirostris TaxID=150288 RepID=UPI000A1C613C|nr:sphingosine-1-phosphate phosphatase 2 isoform X2 [Boleophthalmus pectinirostris]
MLELLAYLQDSELVARFQRCCGLYLIREGAESHHNMSRNQTCRTGTAHKDEACGQPRQRFDNNSNAEYKENGHCVKVVMYVGQVLKDLLKLPRPLSPPVVKLEKRVVAEYGLPSTHAMAATAISFTFLYSAPSRIQFPFEVGLIIAVTLSSLVCLSRIYTGMHSVLDVICGLFISSCILFVTYPFWDTFDHYQLTSPFSPVFGISLPLLLSYTYPKLDHYSTTRGDTTTILGVCAGCSVGYWFNVQLGETFEPKEALPVPLPEITTTSFTYGTVRFVLGVLALVGTRQLVKMFSLHVLYWIYKVPKSDLNARKRKEIEVPYKFVTYTSVGLVNSILVNRAFVYMGLL